MRASAILPVLVAALLGTGRPLLAQTPVAPRVFVDGAVVAERDPTDYFYGTDRGAALRGGVGVHFSPNNTIRFEIDVPQWRVNDTSYEGLVWCAGPTCVNGDGQVPSRSTSRIEVRTVSFSVLYGRQLPAIGRLRLSVVAGGSQELRRYRSSGSFDQLSPDGRVLRHDASQSDNTKYWGAIVTGVDAEVLVTPHLAVLPQFRFHAFPYPEVSIARVGLGLRWRF